MTRGLVVALALLCGAVEAAANDLPVRPGGVDSPSAPLLTLIGETRDLDQLAVEGAWHLGRGRFSLFGGVGYLAQDGQRPQFERIGLFTGGARMHTGWLRRRGYLELCWGPLMRNLTMRSGEPPHQYLTYGPSLLLGYQSVAGSGLTFLAAAGYGYTRSDGRSASNPEFRLGLGYTWRSRSERSRSAALR